MLTVAVVEWEWRGRRLLWVVAVMSGSEALDKAQCLTQGINWTPGGGVAAVCKVVSSSFVSGAYL